MDLTWSAPSKKLKKDATGKEIWHIVMSAEMKGKSQKFWNVWKFSKAEVIKNHFFPKKEGNKWFVMYEVPFTKESIAKVDGVKQYEIDFQRNMTALVALAENKSSSPNPTVRQSGGYQSGNIGNGETEDDFEGIVVEVNYDIPTN